MPINLFGSNYQSPDTFAFMANPSLQWMSMDDFTKKTGSTSTTDYWAAHDVFVAQRVANVNSTTWNNTLPFYFTEERAENNLWRNKKAWYELDDIIHNGGNILSFDTETIGDFRGELTEESRLAGITEIGFYTKRHTGLDSHNFQGVRQIENPQGSFFFGIDSKQKQWLESVLQKKINKEKLTDVEQSALERASRHSTLGSNGFSTFKGTWNNQEYTFVKQLNISRPDSIEDIQSGIEAMAAQYNPNRDSQIQTIIDYINGFTDSGSHRAIIGQNLPYDTQVLNRYADIHGFKGLSDNFEYADSMFALRAWAAQNNTTVAELVKQINPSVTNDRLGSLEALTEAISSSTGYTESLAHNAFEDSKATLELFSHISSSNGYNTHIGNRQTHFNVVDRAMQVLNNMQTEPNSLVLNDAFVKINTQGNIRSRDILVIDGQYTTGYQTTNQYWKFAGTGSTKFDGIDWTDQSGTIHRISETESKYLARFDSVNGDGATLFKTFDDEAAFKSWLTHNTSIVSQHEADTVTQTIIHDRDIARRVIDGFFDPGQVSQYKKGKEIIDAGGFASFQKYYKMYQDLASLSEDAVSSMQLLDAEGRQITNASQLLRNINTGDNIAGIINYADQNGIESITSNFRTSVSSQVDRMTAHQAGIKHYDQRNIMQQVFNMFDENSEFFQYANENITEIDSNLSRTIAFSKMQERYLKSGITQLDIPTGYTIDDLNTVAVKTGEETFTRIDVDNINRGSTQLLRAFSDKSLIDSQVSDRLLGVAEELNGRGLLNDQGLQIIKATHGAGNQPYAVAQSIVTQMNHDTRYVRALGTQTVSTIRDEIAKGDANEIIQMRHGISEHTVNIIREKDHNTLLESATSKMSTISGTLSDSVKEGTKSDITYLKGSVLIGGNFERITDKNGIVIRDDFEGISSILRSMNYDEESIGQYKSIYFQKGQGKSNIHRFNTENLVEGQQEVRSLFFKSEKSEGSAFAIFTRQSDYAKVYDRLSKLDKNATNKQIKQELEGIASYFEIPYLDVTNLGENDIIRTLTGGVKQENGSWKGGHGARSVVVKQGDDFYRYDTLSFNMYEKDGQIFGGIKDQGGNYLTSIRQRAELAYTNIASGDYARGNYAFNNPNIARMSEEAAPMMYGTYDLRGNLSKTRTVSVKDVDYAHAIALDPGEGNLGLLDLMKKLTSDVGYHSAENESVQAENALRGIYKAFGQEYGLISGNKITDFSIEQVYGSEPFKHFYQRYLTAQTEGIGSDRNIIQHIVNGTDKYVLFDQERQAIKALQSDSLLQIMAKASKDNKYVSQSVSRALDLLANHAELDAVGSESFAHKMMMYIGGYHPGMMNNSGSSGLIRPTYTQRANYRSYRLDEKFFTDTDTMATRLGIKFGDAYTSKQYIDFISAMDSKILGKQNMTSETVSRRNIIGAVQSISDTEITAGRTEALEYIIKNNTNGLNENALRKIYDRMVGDINTYEGKAYVRPSVANQEFFALGDPKNIRSAEVHNVFEIGTEAERLETSRILNDLVDKKVTNGTVIGRKLNRNGEFTDIVYRGQTIQRFTEQNATELMNKGKTQAIVERQLEGFKIMFGEEKATAETLSYFHSIDPTERATEVIQTLQSFGLEDQGTLKANIEMLDEYTDLVMDAITRSNQTGYKTIVIGNNNVAKHLSDTAIDSRWNIIAMNFNQQQLEEIAAGIKLSDGTEFMSHIGYNPIYDTLTFDNPTANGSINTLDVLIQRMRESDNSIAQKTVQTIDEFEKHNIALQSIQRQQMNTFQGQAFKIDQRFYQTLVMQGEGDYMHGNGAQLAELIRNGIQEGTYDQYIAGINHRNNINSVWRDIVTNRRGILAPHEETEMFFGTLDAIDYINGKFDISTKNIIKVDAEDLLSRIPKGSGIDAYSNFIFKVNGKDTDYLKSLAKLGKNNANLDYGSSSFYLDLSKYGEFEFNGRKGLTGIVLPYQYLRTADDDMFVGESTKATIKFFRQLQDLNGIDNDKRISAALNDLFKAYGAELSTGNKDSLITKALYKMKMPNSSGALAKDAIVPVINMSQHDIDQIRELQYALSKGFDIDKVKALNEALAKRKSIIQDTQNAILNIGENEDVIPLLNITNDKYAKYLRHYNADGTINGRIIENAVVTSKQMFKNTEMDTGHIGHQLISDYYEKGTNLGLKIYDSFSKLTESEFKITDQELFDALNGIRNTFFDRQNEHKAFGNQLYDVFARINESSLNNEDKMREAVYSFNKELDKYLGDSSIWNKYGAEAADQRRKFLLQIESHFENIGDRYASEVGILGLTGRYPFFNETGVLPVRIFLDDIMKGNEVRFLGPQFSILQNLDFDGDTEFLKFLGNGGLLAKKAQESVLMNSQFDYMNSKNLRIFADSLADSVKEYRYGDEALFKASLLKDLDKASYDIAESRFLGGLTSEALAEVTKEDDVKDFLVAHSKAMRELFADFDIKMGKSINNPDMIKAAIQARIAKEYIGNYSKPNLEIRNAINYMMSLADKDELQELLDIKEALFTVADDVSDKARPFKPIGLLTWLEQKGIDTKHVHDAATLNNSSAWRVGIFSLFENANGAETINQEKIQQAMVDLVEGARKVFFSDSEKTNAEIAQDILGKTFSEWNQLLKTESNSVPKVSSELLGETYLSALYTLSRKENAYQGFHGVFRTSHYQEITNGLLDMTVDDVNKLFGGDYTLDAPVKAMLMSNMFNTYRTDANAMTFGRALRQGDILAYEGDNGPIAIMFDSIERTDRSGRITGGKITAFKYNLETGEKSAITDWGGSRGRNYAISIRDFNENIKKYKNGALLNLSDLDTPEWNLNVRSITDSNRQLVRQRIASLYTEHNLQWFFDNTDDIDAFKTMYGKYTQASNIITGYNTGQNESLGKVFAKITGGDAEQFRRRVIDINERIQYGLNNGMIYNSKGSSDAKELIRSINKQIAENPRKNIGRITGDNVEETINAYLNGTGVQITNREFLTRDLASVQLSNQISETIDTRITTRDARIGEIATEFYNNIVQNNIDEAKAFEQARESFESEMKGFTQDIFDSIRKASNPQEELMYRFGWDAFKTSDDFIINMNNVKMDSRIAKISNARVGFGQFTGIRFQDLSEVQKGIIEQEIEKVLPDLADDSLEKLAAINTRELIKEVRVSGNVDSVLNFTNSETLLTSYKAVYNPKLQEFGERVAEETLNKAKEDAIRATQEASQNIEKKTLLKDIKGTFKNMSPETSRYLKIGAGIVGGVTALGLVGHALFDNDSHNNVEIPRSVEQSLEEQNVNIKNKSDAEYSNAPSSAKSTHKQRKLNIAPPSLPKNRTIYHDAGSGFNFKVSAQSYNKLQAESYQRMMQGSGVNNGRINISRDNSKITDNWLANKFAQLTE